ncbi:uncharacterized protein LOC126372394 [Pectinophora gossypiella]|uniref:uncharacterized protein LOC126372394 n=1 Tax=Pectinophora gossypiella TaxID=13191 RepID=UPI00214F0567|nr:uncharacterized protein LOC126372394 [Pectinophora gossypiella]
MVAKFVVLSLALAVCQAGPVWVDGSGYYPGMILRIGRSPNIAYAFGSGMSTNIGGISHSTSIGSSFQTGDAEAYGAGVAATNGGVYARGVGYTNAAPAYPLAYQQSAASAYNGGLGRTGYGSAVSSAQNYGSNFGSAASSAQTHNGFGLGSAVSSVQNAGPARYQSAVSSAQNLRGVGSSVAAANSNTGLGYGSAASSAHNAGGNYGSALSSVQAHNGFNNYNAAVSAAENVNGYGGSTSQVVQHRAGTVQHSGASSVNGPGVQAAQSHAVNTGFY